MRWWIGTVPFNDWTANIPAWVGYARGQAEIGDSGYKHIQLVVWTPQPSRLSRLKTWIATAHWEPTKSDAAIAYVWKESTRVDGSQFELGSFPRQRNSKHDWAEIKSLAISGKFDDIPPDVYIRHYSTLKRIALDHLQPAAVERTAELFVGPTGTGKSRRAWDEAGLDAYIKNPNTKWWDGYKGQTNVVIDEFRGRIDPSYLLTWLDRYPVQVETKGGGQPLMATRFWICSNIQIKDWYPDVGIETIQALERRIKVIQFYYGSEFNSETPSTVVKVLSFFVLLTHAIFNSLSYCKVIGLRVVVLNNSSNAII